MYALPRPQWDTDRRAKDHADLLAISDGDTLCYTSEGGAFFAPADKESLARLYSDYPDATIISGATDAGLWVTKQHRPLPKIIYTGRVDALKQIAIEGDVMSIGAGVPWAEAGKALENRWPSFAELVRRFGSEQVRNSGTVGGNIANGSPIGDGPPALIALGARVLLRKGDASRSLPLKDFFIAYGRQDRTPGEIVEAIEVPLATRCEELRCYKISKRFDQDISAVCGCFNIRVEDGRVTSARIAFGGMAATPKRAATVESLLLGSAWNLETVERAVAGFEDDYSPIGDMRASAAYRLKAAKNLLIRYFHEREGAAGSIQLAGSLLPVFA